MEELVLVHRTDQDTTEQKEQLREGGNINSRVEDQDRGRLGQTICVVRNEGRRRCMGWIRWIQKETLRWENWKFGKMCDLGGITVGEKIMVFGLGAI